MDALGWLQRTLAAAVIPTCAIHAHSVIDRGRNPPTSSRLLQRRLLVLSPTQRQPLSLHSQRAISSAHDGDTAMFQKILSAYGRHSKRGGVIINRFKEVRLRGRKRPMVG